MHTHLSGRSLLSTLLALSLMSSLISPLLLSGCAEEDKTPPIAPNLTLQDSPTDATLITLSGTAEARSVVKVTREPAFSEAEISAHGPFEIQSDAYTSTWALRVPLVVDVDNLFTITATDAKGNESEPATLTVSHRAPVWVSLAISAEPTRAAAGEPVFVRVSGVDSYGRAGAVSERLEVSSSDSAATLEAGKVTHTLAGAKVLTATADGVSATAEVLISPASPSALTLALDATDVDDVAEGLQVLPETSVGVTWAVVDAYGNPVDPPVTLSTDAPSLFEEGALTHLTEAGRWTIIATVFGSSLSAVSELEVVPGPLSSLALALSTSRLTAGGSLSAAVSAADAWGNPIDGLSLTLSTTAPDGGAAVDVADSLVTFTAAGAWEVVASSPADPQVEARAGVQVDSAPTSVVDLVLTPSPAALTPDEILSYAITATDAYGNPSQDLIRVMTDAPGAIIANGQIQNITQAGSFTVWAEATGLGVSDAEPVTVSHGDVSAIDLVLTRPTQPTDLPLRYSVRVVDAWGNAIMDPVSLASSDPAATFNEAESTVTFGSTGIQTVTAAYGEMSDTEGVVVFLEPDVLPPTVAVVEPTPETVVYPGDTITVRVDTSDDRSLSQVQLQIRGAFRYDDFVLVPTGLTDYSAYFTLRVPTNADYGAAEVVAAAYDDAGNVLVGQRSTFLVNPSARLVIPGGSATFIAGGPNTRLNNPIGLDHDGAGSVVVANSSDQNVVRVDLATGAIAQVGVSVGQSVVDVAYSPSGEIFALTTNRVVLFDIEGSLIDPWSATLNAQLNSLTLDTAGARLYMTDNNNDLVRRYNTASNSPVSPDFSTNANNLLNGAAGVAVMTNGAGQELIYVSNDNNNRVIEHNRTTNTSRTLTQGNAISTPRALALLPNGDLLVANEGSNSIVKISLSTCANTPCSTRVVASGFSRLSGISVDPSSTVDLVKLVASDRNWDALIEVSFTP